MSEPRNAEASVIALTNFASKMGRLRHKFHSFVESIRDHCSLVITEYCFRRELRKLFGKAPENTGRWPQLSEAARARRSAKIRDKVLVGTTEDLNKKVAHAKRRDLCVVRSASSDSIIVFGEARKITDE